MQVEFVEFGFEDKGKYKMGNVTYRKDGKLGEKKIMSFGDAAEVFKYFEKGGAKKGDVLEVKTVKNDKGFWDWVGVGTGGATAQPAASTGGGNANPGRSNFETPDERAARQVLIVRQSSLANAIEYLKFNPKKVPSVQEVVDVARFFEDYVYGKTTKPTDNGTLAEMEDDIPL